MTNRVTHEEVNEIINNSLEDLTPFITAANLLVDDLLSEAGHSAALLKEIERWTAAHFVSTRIPQAKAEKIGDASITYERGESTGVGLMSSSYGKQAALLDTSGILAQTGKKAASMETMEIELI